MHEVGASDRDATLAAAGKAEVVDAASVVDVTSDVVGVAGVVDVTSGVVGVAGVVECAACGRPLARGVSLAASDGQPARWKCRRCALFDRNLAVRSGRVAAFVGSVLIAVNQGDQLLTGSFPFATSWWKLPLTYLVPFLVASYGAISNGDRPVRRG